MEHSVAENRLPIVSTTLLPSHLSSTSSMQRVPLPALPVAIGFTSDGQLSVRDRMDFSRPLTKQQQLPCLHPLAYREPVEIHTRRQFQSGIVHAIPAYRVRFRLTITLYQRRYSLRCQIVDR